VSERPIYWLGEERRPFNSPSVPSHSSLNITHKDSRREVLQLLGIIHAQSDPPDVEPAEASYRQALACAEELGMHRDR